MIPTAMRRRRQVQPLVAQPAAAMDDEQQSEQEPVTPAGRMFIQPKMSCNILAIFGFRDEIDVPGFKQHLGDTIAKHKRFSSLLVERKDHKPVWVPVKLNIDDHIIVPSLSQEQKSSTTCAQDYAAELALAPPLDPSRPLWEFHILEPSTCIFRIHHSLGDGTSLMSLFMSCTRKLDHPDERPSMELRKNQSSRESGFDLRRFWSGVWTLLLVLWASLVGIGRFLLISLFLEDSRTAIKGTAGVEHSAKRIVAVELSLDDMKTVKRAVGGTINDVFVGLISAGVGRYLQHAQQGLRVHASALVNTRKTPGPQELADMMNGSSKARWGNHMGYVLIPLILKECENPLDYVRSAKKTLDRKKLSLEPYFTYAAGALLMKIAGPKAATEVVYRTQIHTTFAISNVVGPFEQVTFCGNPITSIMPTVTGQPQALCLHLQSYMGKAMLVATAATSVIPDPQALLQHCTDALREMKDAATGT